MNRESNEGTTSNLKEFREGTEYFEEMATSSSTPNDIAKRSFKNLQRNRNEWLSPCRVT